SINVMPYSMFKKLGLGEPKPTKMSITLANKSVRHPRGIIENILVKVDKFLFPVDFVVLDMQEDFEAPLIFGRPFLAITRALIDVEQRKLILRVQEEEVILEMAHDYFPDNSSCYKVEAVSEIKTHISQSTYPTGPLDQPFMSRKQIDDELNGINDL